MYGRSRLLVRGAAITRSFSPPRVFWLCRRKRLHFFGRAFFKESLPVSGSFQEVFQKSEKLIRTSELDDQKTASTSKAESKPATIAGAGDNDDHSLPQMIAGSSIEGKLQNWSAEAVKRKYA
jgi:hypothetical protein